MVFLGDLGLSWSGLGWLAGWAGLGWLGWAGWAGEEEQRTSYKRYSDSPTPVLQLTFLVCSLCSVEDSACWTTHG